MKTRFVAEFTTNHFGHLKLLIKMAHAAKNAGADFIKMQKKDVGHFYAAEKLALPYKSPFGKTYKDYREMFELTKEEFCIFDRECKDIGIDWYCTAQDEPSLDFLLPFNLSMYKIASTNARNWKFIEYLKSCIDRSKTIVVSVAGSTVSEIMELCDMLKEFDDIILQHCVALYPCPIGKTSLGNITYLKYITSGCDNIQIGYSGHEVGYIPSIFAARLGATMIERHFCISRNSFVHHIDCSLEPNEFKEMVSGIQNNVDIELFMSEQDITDINTSINTNHFGMSVDERSFLIDNVYGTSYLK